MGDVIKELLSFEVLGLLFDVQRLKVVDGPVHDAIEIVIEWMDGRITGVAKEVADGEGCISSRCG